MSLEHSLLNSDDGTLLPTKKAAVVLGVSSAYLERDRWAGARNGKGPLIPYIKVTPRSVRYRLGDLREHLIKRRISSDNGFGGK